MGEDGDGFSLPGVSQPKDTADEDPEPLTARPPSDVGQHDCRLAALIAETALQEVNAYEAMDVTVFMDSERLLAVGRRMHVAGQEATPIPGPHSPESDRLPLLLAQYAKRTRELLELVDFTLEVPTFSFACWEGDAIPAPQPPGLAITLNYVIEGKVELRLPTNDGGTCPCWWLRAMAYVYASSAPTPPQAARPDIRALVLVYQCSLHVLRGTPMPPPPPPSAGLQQMGGNRYAPVDTAWLDLGDHRATLSLPGGLPLVITRPWCPRPPTTTPEGD